MTVWISTAGGGVEESEGEGPDGANWIATALFATITILMAAWLVADSAAILGMMTSPGSRREGPSTERVTARGPVATIEVQGTAGLACIAYPGLVVHRASLDGDEVTVVVDEAALGVADANGCGPGTRGVVDARRWEVWRGARRR